MSNKTAAKNNPNFHIESTGSTNQQEVAFGSKDFFLWLTLPCLLRSPQQTFHYFLLM